MLRRLFLSIPSISVKTSHIGKYPASISSLQYGSLFWKRHLLVVFWVATNPQKPESSVFSKSLILKSKLCVSVGYSCIDNARSHSVMFCVASCAIFRMKELSDDDDDDDQSDVLLFFLNTDYHLPECHGRLE